MNDVKAQKLVSEVIRTVLAHKGPLPEDIAIARQALIQEAELPDTAFPKILEKPTTPISQLETT